MRSGCVRSAAAVYGCPVPIRSQSLGGGRPRTAPVHLLTEAPTCGNGDMVMAVCSMWLRGRRGLAAAGVGLDVDPAGRSGASGRQTAAFGALAGGGCLGRVRPPGLGSCVAGDARRGAADFAPPVHHRGRPWVRPIHRSGRKRQACVDRREREVDGRLLVRAPARSGFSWSSGVGRGVCGGFGRGGAGLGRCW